MPNLIIGHSGVAKKGGGPPRAARPRGGISYKPHVIIFLNHFKQLLLGYIAYLLIVNHLTVVPRRKVAEMGPAISFTLWCIPASIKKILFY